jgi:NAD(P)-dependent dehydrogenase (short-subunit alcohol dehydrogenase family)
MPDQPVALVTGASSGIGEQAALGLHRAGFAVCAVAAGAFDADLADVPGTAFHRISARYPARVVEKLLAPSTLSAMPVSATRRLRLAGCVVPARERSQA